MLHAPVRTAVPPVGASGSTAATALLGTTVRAGTFSKKNAKRARRNARRRAAVRLAQMRLLPLRPRVLQCSVLGLGLILVSVLIVVCQWFVGGDTVCVAPVCAGGDTAVCCACACWG